MARTRYALGSVEIVSSGITLKQCPITGGRATRMSQSSFAAHCARHRKRSSVHYFQGNTEIARNENYSNWCSVCQGKKPEELTIISRAEVVRMHTTMAGSRKGPGNHTEGENMGSKKVRGKCEGGCGDSQMLATNYGVMMCTTCGNVHANVRNRSETVVAAIRRTGMLEWYIGQLVGEGSTVAGAVESDLLQRIAGLLGYPGNDAEGLLAAIQTKNELLDEYRKKQREQHAPQLELQHIADMVAWPGKESGPLPAWVDSVLVAGQDAIRTLSQLKELFGVGEQSVDYVVSQLTQALDQYRTRCEELTAKERETAQLAAYHEQVLVAVRDALGSPLIPLAETAYRVEVLQQELEQLRDGTANPSAKPSALDSHLLDLLIDYPAISLERIATIREAV